MPDPTAPHEPPRGTSVAARRFEAHRRQQRHRALILREQAARSEAEATSRRYAFLAQAGAVLNASLDYRTTLAAFARMTVPAMADVCAVHLLQPDGTLELAEVATIDPNPYGPPPDRPLVIPPEPDASDGLWAVVRTGRSQLDNSISDRMLERHASDPEMLERYRRGGIVSGIAVPIPIRGAALGVLSLVSCDPSRRYTKQDVAIAEEIGRLCGVAIDHGRLYADAQREIAERRAAEERLRIQSRQQAIVAQLGHLSLIDGSLPAFLEAALAALAETLGLDVAGLTQLDGDRITLRARFGASTPIGTVWSLAESGSMTDYTLSIGKTVLVDDLGCETRFRPTPDLLRTGMVSGLSTPIVGAGGIEGILSGVARVRRQFSSDDQHFIEAVANLIAGAWGRAHAAAALDAERERLAVTLRSIGDGVIATDTEARIVLLNTVAETMTGWAQAEAIGKPIEAILQLVHARTGVPVVNPVMRALASKSVQSSTDHHRLHARDGTERVVTKTAAPIRDAEGRGLGVVLVLRDDTEKVRKDAEIQHAGTLESMGLFAGGIAHDFNNILAGILGNLSLARLRLPPEEAIQTRLAEAERAAIRARDLTQQLLTFAKGGTPIRKRTCIEEMVRESASFVLRESSVQPHFEVEPGLWNVEVDSGQISQVVQNLVINARQAMPKGGRVDLFLRNVDLADPGVPLPPGRYVRIQVVDAGVGIGVENLSRVFLPYFTTKRRGSGLGLATSYSIVKRHDGHIMLESKLGAGSCFSVYLPAAGDQSTSAPADVFPSPLHGSGRVLVMDDEDVVREMLTLLLEELGFEVTATEDGDQAIDAWRRALAARDPYDCVVMDLTVPGGMGGLPALRGILAIDPTARGIVSSGYSEDPVMSDHAAYGFTAVLTKPYTLAELTRVMRAVLQPVTG
ncbi:MAG: GAF domain-containing protein [Pseudomonadota bacterium]|nr:GAF domain-containing protein [Pseudomonadota bacterium]